MKRIKVMIMLLGCLLCFSSSICVNAEEEQLSIFPPELFEITALDENNTTTISWNPGWTTVDAAVSVVYDVEVSKDKSFTETKKYSLTSPELTYKRSQFGTHGDELYVRAKITVTGAYDIPLVSEWSDVQTWTVLKIDKTNFPGMYKHLKKGGRIFTDKGIQSLTYDTNGDGWLDNTEVNNIYQISNLDYYKKNKLVKKADKISSFKGIEYFRKVSYINVERYASGNINLSKCPAILIDIRKVTAKKITVNAPNAKSIYVEADDAYKVSKLDFSKCKSVRDLCAYGQGGTKTLILPSYKKNLQVLSVSDCNLKTLNVNVYTKLKQLYVYRSNVKTVKVNKCKNLHYIYFYCCTGIKKLDLSANKNLIGADFYRTKGLTKKTVQKPKKAKVTWEQGKWWYDTEEYKEEMENLYK